MTFQEAEEKARKLAGMRWVTVSYEKMFFWDGESRAECRVSAQGFGSHSGPTWQSAFAKLERAMAGLPQIDNTEAPTNE